jgi:hypothetical protein
VSRSSARRHIDDEGPAHWRRRQRSRPCPYTRRYRSRIRGTARSER